jgi:tetratricopeptide (TPR) repeat protein
MSVERAITLQEQAWSLQVSGKNDEAFVVCQEALRLIEESEGPDSPDAANLLNDLAEIEQDRQHFPAALALAERARAVEDSLDDGFSGDTAAHVRGKTLELLGLIRCKLGDYPRAEVDLKAALAIAAAQFGAVSEEAAEAQNNLAVLYKFWGRFDEALRLYASSLQTVISLHGEGSLASGVIYHNIGGVLHAQGDFAAAEGPALRAWEISRHLLGDDDLGTQADAAAYAAILDGLEKYEESERIYRWALVVFERAFGPRHLEVAATLHNLAAVRDARGDLAEAEQCYRRALEIKEELLGCQTPDAATTRHNLGSLLRRAGRYTEATPLLESALAIFEEQLSPGHPHLAIARENLQKAIGERW